MALTKKRIDAARYEGDGKSWDVRPDGTIRGLSLRVYPSGAKSFILRYRHGGRVRTVTLGRYGVLTLDQARRKANRMLAELTEGLDPAEEKRRKRAQSVPLDTFAERWLEDYARAHRRSWREDKRRIENRINPALGRRSLAAVTPGDVAKLHAKIGKTAPVEANRVVQLLRAIFNAAIAWQVLPKGHENPAQVSRSPYSSAGKNVRTFGEQSRERFVRPDEMPALLKAIEVDRDSQARAVLKLLLFTGCRKSEILRAKWEDVDLDRGELRLEVAKSGSRLVQLSTEAVQVLSDIPHDGSPYLFPSPQDPSKPRSDIKKAWKRIRTAAKLEDVHLHDIRRTVGAWLANAGASELLIGKVLGHRDPAATRIYARLTDETSRQALEEFAAAVRRSRLSVS
jgi:integrase